MLKVKMCGIVKGKIEVTNFCRQLDGLKIESSYLDGFMSHLQNEVKDTIIEEEANLHVYSSNDVDMLVPSQIQPCAFLSTKHLAFLISFSRKIITQK
jgi:hypothetical protein